LLDKKKILSLGTLLLPWLTVPLIGRNSFIRFLPVTTFVNFILALVSIPADNRKWWKVKNPLFPKSVIDFSYLLGLFFIGTIWIFKLTYGNFVKYLITNVVMDSLLAFPVTSFFKKVGVFEFKKMKKINFFYITVSLAIILYGYQYTIEKIIRKST
jgi:hypothetical protein